MQFVILLFFAVPCFAQFLWNETQLQQVRQSLQKNDSPFLEAFIDLKNKAQELSLKGDVSVMDKRHIPASSDKHDYMSLSRYYWPDSSKPNGLPYISRDGLSNPELKEYDRNTLDEMSRRINTFTLVWLLSGDSIYANLAVRQIRSWFIDKETRMNPNMNYAQITPGRNNDRGRSFGVLDGYSFVQTLDALWLLKNYDGYSKADQEAVQAWFTDYVQWLTTSEQGIAESQTTNNHGTTYDTQLLAYSIFIGNRKLPQKLIKEFAQRHILKQIELDGKQPKELSRTLAYHYSWYNLSHMLDFYIIAKNQGFNIDIATEIQGHSFYKAVDFLSSYINKDASKWPYKQISGWNNVQEELIRDMYRIYILIDHRKVNYKQAYKANRNAGYSNFKLLYVKEEDL